MPCDCRHMTPFPDPRFTAIRGSAFGSQLVKSITQPAAGAQFSVTVPGGRAWLVRSVHFRLVTDATAGTRGARIEVETQGVVVLQMLAGAGQGASLTRDYTFARGLASAERDTIINAPIVDPLLLLPADVISSAVVSMAAGDQISNVRLWVVEFDYPAGV